MLGSKFVWQKIVAPKAAVTQGEPIATQTVNDLTMKLYGQVRKGPSEVLIEFRDANDQLVDVGDVNFTIDMNMPGMVMRGGGSAQKTGTAGQYQAKVTADMAGDWNAKISFQGPRGQAQTNFSVNVAQ